MSSVERVRAHAHSILLRCLWRSFIQKLFLSFFQAFAVFGFRFVSFVHSFVAPFIFLCFLFIFFFFYYLDFVPASVMCLCVVYSYHIHVHAVSVPVHVLRPRRLLLCWLHRETGCGILINRQWKTKKKKTDSFSFIQLIFSCLHQWMCP